MFRHLLVLAIILCFAGVGFAGEAGLSWDPPTTNEDGTPLTDLQGYKVYYGQTARGAGAIYPPAGYATVKDVGNVVSYTVTGLTEGDWWFAATAYDVMGNESKYSNEVKKSVIIRPANPSNVR